MQIQYLACFHPQGFVRDLHCHRTMRRTPTMFETQRQRAARQLGATPLSCIATAPTIANPAFYYLGHCLLNLLILLFIIIPYPKVLKRDDPYWNSVQIIKIKYCAFPVPPAMPCGCEVAAREDSQAELPSQSSAECDTGFRGLKQSGKGKSTN